MCGVSRPPGAVQVGDDFGVDVTCGAPMFEVAAPDDAARTEFIQRLLAQVMMQTLGAGGAGRASASGSVDDNALQVPVFPVVSEAAKRRRESRR